MRQSIWTGIAEPQSFVTRGKKRLKQYIDTVYLNNGEEFEIELYNPTKNKVLAKIELNGNSIGNGIILRPGERVFLERYLDEAKKFLFETYIVNGNNEEVQQAISNNGDVVVKFYKEITSQINGSNTVTWTNNPFTINNSTGRFFDGTTTYTSAISPTTFTTSNTFGSINTYYNYNIPTNDNLTYEKIKTSPIRHLETGRVEKGSNSDQTFTYDNTSFYSFPFHTNWWKIKPNSTKVMVKEDLVVYCTECGAKRKKDNHKFCPHCGTKF